MVQDLPVRASNPGADNIASSPKKPPAWSSSSSSDASASSTSYTIDGVTVEQMNCVRSHLEHGRTADDATVRRFIRATGGNLPLSAKRLNATLAWRDKVKPEQVVCRACVKDPRSHYMHLVGYCQRGRPIIYSCLEAATNRIFEDNRDHMIQSFEMAIKCMPPGVEQWIWVCDFKGFGMVDVNPKLAKLFLDISAEHYPERLALFMVVDAPSLFGMLWKAISPFVDPKTYKKIRFLPFDAGKSDSLSKSRLKHEMDLHFDPVTTDWFIREMSENRDKAKVRHKSYNMYSLYEMALNGELCDGHEHTHCHHGHLATAAKRPGLPATADAHAGPAEAAAASRGATAHEQQQQQQPLAVHARSGETAAAAAAAAHNLLGTPALLHSYNMNPDLLLPQATASATGPRVGSF